MMLQYFFDSGSKPPSCYMSRKLYWMRWTYCFAFTLPELLSLRFTESLGQYGGYVPQLVTEWVRVRIPKLWKTPPTHAWYNRQAPGGALPIKADRVVQTTISRLASGHIRGLSFNLGQKIYENCTKCNLVQATPDHLLFCAGLEREDIYSSPLLVYDFLRTLGLMDLNLLEGYQPFISLLSSPPSPVVKAGSDLERFPGGIINKKHGFEHFRPTKNLPTTVTNGFWNAGCGFFGVKEP
ncbi:RNase H domain-containing protein [Trichonephila clavipes]|nr:RNase H domain-containing protein [Trichonephila clavipes]